MDDPILVSATLPATPLVLADSKFLVALVGVEAQVAAINVTNAEQAQEAANLLSRLTKAGTSLESTRKQLKKPFLEIGDSIDSLAKGIAGRIAHAKAKLSRVLGDFNAREAERLAEEQRKRAAELAALEAKRAAEEAAEQARIAALAAATPAAEAIELEFDAPAPAPKTETEQQIDVIKYAPAPVAQRVAGVGFRQTLKFKVGIIDQLPETFILRTVNEALIRQTYCVGFKDGMPLPVVPGITFFVEHTAVASGRATQ